MKIYRHNFLNKEEEERYKWLSEQRKNQIESSIDPHDHCDSKKSHAHRAHLFVEWLIEKFTKEKLNEGTGMKI